ncbi:hypothetical protein Slin14017_G111930 [Septoria linicola]|nr:hypothetical protein Slin14017_G111930 [Septoria linicola]
MAGLNQPVANASSSAASRVFAVFELAETIFLDVPTRDIITNFQRTCKQFKEVIKESTPIQQALFLKPYGELQVAGPLYGCSDGLTGNRITCHIAMHCPLVSQYRHGDPDTWPAMFCTQPPVNTLKVSTVRDLQEQHEVESSDGLGVRFKDIFAARNSSAYKLWFIQGFASMTSPQAGSTAMETLRLIRKGIETHLKLRKQIEEVE